MDLQPGARAILATQLDGVGQSLYQLEEGITSAVSALGKLGITTTATALLKTAVETGECASALGETGGDVLAKCLPSLLKKAYGTQGALAAAAIQVGSIAEFFRSESNALFDQLNHRDEYRISVTRATAETPTPLTTSAPVATTTAAPPSTNSTTSAQANSASLAIGSSFEDDCVVAWPTAPTRTSHDIQMTMTCQHVPEGEYLFTVVVYGDPNFPITPSTGSVHVIGHVVDVAQSSYGFKELVVDASSVEIP